MPVDKVTPLCTLRHRVYGIDSRRGVYESRRTTNVLDNFSIPSKTTATVKPAFADDNRRKAIAAVAINIVPMILLVVACTRAKKRQYLSYTFLIRPIVNFMKKAWGYIAQRSAGDDATRSFP